MHYANEETYQGEKAVVISFGKYRATLLPEIGGNLISFVDTERDYHFLREPQPEDMTAFKENPFAYGIPVLFPPNRYDNGTFTINNKTYTLPVNEQAKQNHLHGFFHSCPWEVAELGHTAEESYVVIRQHVTERHPAYTSFPHEFRILIRYALTAEGLRQDVTVTNLGDIPMPCMIGFHTAISAPFIASSTPEDMLVELTIGERFELDQRMLPTGQTQPLTEAEQRLKKGGVSPYFAKLDNHYNAVVRDGRNYMSLTDQREQVQLTYEAGPKYAYWMIWNNDAKSGFFCPEPQTNMVNAPNVALPYDQTGVTLLAPGESWSESCRFTATKL